MLYRNPVGGGSVYAVHFALPAPSPFEQGGDDDTARDSEFSIK